jgi:hypothetical protein
MERDTQFFEFGCQVGVFNPFGLVVDLFVVEDQAG